MKLALIIVASMVAGGIIGIFLLWLVFLWLANREL